MLDENNFRIFRPYGINFIIKALIVSDFLVFTGSNLLAPILAIFIEQQIKGAGLQVVGLASTCFFVAKAMFEVPVGLHIDRTKSERDDLAFTVGGTLIMSVAYFLFIFIDAPWQLYILQALLGLATAIAYPGWYGLFTRHADQNHRAFEWSLYHVGMFGGMAIGAAAGAFFVSHFGFHYLFLAISLITLGGALSLLSIKNRIK
jgi:MFS family permease